MKKVLFAMGALIFLLACSKTNRDLIEITVSSWEHVSNDRNGKDYVRLWIDDTLLFSDTFHVNYIHNIPETWHEMDMKVANINITDRDILKIRIRLVSLDSVLFRGHHAVDTTFRYKVDNISCMNIDYYRGLNRFRVVNPVANPEFYRID